MESEVSVKSSEKRALAVAAKFYLDVSDTWSLFCAVDLVDTYSSLWVGQEVVEGLDDLLGLEWQQAAKHWSGSEGRGRRGSLLDGNWRCHGTGGESQRDDSGELHLEFFFDAVLSEWLRSIDLEYKESNTLNCVECECGREKRNERWAMLSYYIFSRPLRNLPDDSHALVARSEERYRRGRTAMPSRSVVVHGNPGVHALRGMGRANGDVARQVRSPHQVCSLPIWDGMCDDGGEANMSPRQAKGVETVL